MSTAKSQEQAFESVEVIISAGNNELLEVDAKTKTINIDVENKQFLKGLIKIGRDFTKKQNADKETKEKDKQKSPSALATARTVAEILKKNGITITLLYKGRVVAALGAEAHSTLLQLITKTRVIALKSPLRAIRMII